MRIAVLELTNMRLVAARSFEQRKPIALYVVVLGSAGRTVRTINPGSPISIAVRGF